MGLNEDHRSICVHKPHIKWNSIGKNSSRKSYPGEKEEISIFLGNLQIQSAHIADMIEMEGGWNNQNGGRLGGGGGGEGELGQGKL